MILAGCASYSTIPSTTMSLSGLHESATVRCMSTISYYRRSGQLQLGYWRTGPDLCQHNYFHSTGTLPAALIIHAYGGSAIYIADTLLNGQSTNVLTAYNAAHHPALAGTVDWHPAHAIAVELARAVPQDVPAGAGPSPAH